MSRTTARHRSKTAAAAGLIGLAALLAASAQDAVAAPAPPSDSTSVASWCSGDLSQLDDQLRATGFTAQAAHNLAGTTLVDCAAGS